MFLHKSLLSIFVLLCLSLQGGLPAAERKAGPLSKEARELMEFLQSIEGKKTVSGISSYTGLDPILQRTGILPALLAEDVYGHVERGTPAYDHHLEIKISTMRDWWQVRGGIVAAHFHWGQPGYPHSSAWPGKDKKNRGLEPINLGRAVTPGTDEYKAVMADLKMTCDYLQPLKDDRIPVLWRPMHEIDGGWFWWTDTRNPENTVKLWKIMYEYMAIERQFDNLIWVYNPAHLSMRNEPPDVQLAHRKKFYPGDEYVDMAGLDIYGSSANNAAIPWGPPEEESYVDAYAMMQEIAPGKLLAICESGAFPNPDKMLKDGAKWVYIAPWWAGGGDAYLKFVYGHDFVLSLDELPNLTHHNTAPVISILDTEEGVNLDERLVRLSGRVSDRDHNLESVTVYAIPGPWISIAKRNAKELEEYLASGNLLGVAAVQANGSWTFETRSMKRGIHTLVARARDTEGLSARSNFLRCTAGMENLAQGKEASASFANEEAQQVVDGQIRTQWHCKESKEHWLMVDLGENTQIGGVSVFWSVYNPSHYEIQISTDSKNWTKVAEMKPKRNWQGDMDAFRLGSLMTARYVRVVCQKARGGHQGYMIREIGVYAGMPMESASQEGKK